MLFSVHHKEISAVAGFISPEALGCISEKKKKKIKKYTIHFIVSQLNTTENWSLVWKLRARNQYPWQAVRNKATPLSDSMTPALCTQACLCLSQTSFYHLSSAPVSMKPHGVKI